MAGAPDAPSPNFFGKSPAKRPERSPGQGRKTISQKYLSSDIYMFIADIHNERAAV